MRLSNYNLSSNYIYLNSHSLIISYVIIKCNYTSTKLGYNYIVFRISITNIINFTLYNLLYINSLSRQKIGLSLVSRECPFIDLSFISFIQ